MAPTGTIGTSDVTVTVNCGTALYAVHGTILGVVGDVILQNGADVISVGNGSFSFPADLTTGSTYSVWSPHRSATARSPTGAERLPPRTRW